MLVNNTRDIRTDTQAGKHTLAVRIGEAQSKVLYQADLPLRLSDCRLSIGIYPVYLYCSRVCLLIARKLSSDFYAVSGEALNPLLGRTAKLTMIFSTLFSVGLVFTA